MTRPADSEVTTAIADIIKKHLLVRYDRRAWWCQCGDDCLKIEGSHAEHVASVLLASFELVPKGQLHQEWGSGLKGQTTPITVGYDDAESATDDKLGFRALVRLVGPWRPAP